MAAPFAQTSRSLTADRGIAAVVILAVAGLLLAAWLTWTFTARFSVYVVSQQGPIRLDNLISVTFDAVEQDKLSEGQPARIFLNAPPLSEPVTLSAKVIRVTEGQDGVRVDVAPDFSQFDNATISPEILAAFEEPVDGHVEVEVESISPATLVLRTSGLNAETAPLVSRP